MIALSATYTSILASVPGVAQTGRLAYRRTGDADYLPALDAWTSEGITRGSLVDLEAGTSYDVRLTVDGVEHLGTITTRADDLVPLEQLVPTHYVRLDGADTNDGATPETAWRTIKRALQVAPAGAVVQVGSGEADEFFTDSGYATGAPGPRTLPITLVAHTPAVSATRQVTNVGRRTFIEGSIRAVPAGVAVDGIPAAPWVLVNLLCPDGATRSVWKWAGAVPSGTLISFGYLQTRTGVMSRLWHWDHVGPLLQTPESWLEVLHTNQTFRYGFYQAGTDLYARLPNDRNPNARYWSGTTSAGIGFNCPDSRVSGFVIRGMHFGIRGGPGSSRLVVERNEFQMVTSGVMLSATVSPVAYAADVLCERNLVRNTGLWSADQTNDPSAPWDFVKRRMRLADGSEYPYSRVGGRIEGSGFLLMGAHRAVIRSNTIQGTFDGVGTVNVVGAWAEPPEPAPMNDEWDVHDNLIRQIPDDAVEPAQKANWRVWGNRVEHTKTFLSTGSPTQSGVLYCWRNVAWRTGGYGLAPDLLGRPAGGQDGMIFKFDGMSSSSKRARFYVVNNTFWSDWSGAYADGTPKKCYGGDDAAGSGSHAAQQVLRNNIVRMTDVCWDAYSTAWDEDYNQFGTSHATKGMKITNPAASYSTFALYQAGTGCGAHSNAGVPDLHDTATLDAQFVNAPAGSLTLVAGSPLRGIGCPVPLLAPELAPNLGA